MGKNWMSGEKIKMVGIVNKSNRSKLGYFCLIRIYSDNKVK